MCEGNETVYNDDERLAVLSPLHLNVTACDVSEETGKFRTRIIPHARVQEPN